MALTVEDGTIVAGAESYCSVAFANDYHAKRGNISWESVDDQEAALRRATDYMGQMYRGKWRGFRKSAAQALDWPRMEVYLEPFVYGVTGDYPYLVSNTIVPEEVKRACAEYALRAAAGELSPDLTRAKSSVRVGDIAVTYDQASAESPRYRAIDALLAPYLSGSSINMKVVRS